MNLNGQRLAVGAIVATGLTGILLVIVSLNGFQNPSTGDVAISSMGGRLLSLAILLVGMLGLLSLELTHTMRRLQHAAVASAVATLPPELVEVHGRRTLQHGRFVRRTVGPRLLRAGRP